MNLFETLKQFKNVAPDSAYKEKSKRAILATMPREHWSWSRTVAAIFETGIAVGLAAFFILFVTGQFSNSPVAPVQFSVINPETLHAEAQAVDIQIQLAKVAYQEATTTPIAAAAINETTPETATSVGASAPEQTQSISAILSGAATTTATSSAGSASPTETPVQTSTPISVDQALEQLSAALFVAQGTAHAQDVCTPSQADFAALKAIQNNPGLTSSQELSQEIALRRQLLSQTISCATADAQSLQATITAVTPVNAQGQNIQSQLSGNISNAINFYAIESSKLNDAGVSATEAIAKEMIAWRSANYAPLEGDVNNFALWSENQALFDTAQNRLAQTGRVVAFIENAASGNGDIDAAFQSTQKSFNDAENENAAAGTAIGQVQPADETLGLIQQSLQSLADTYQKFGDLNVLIQKLLPTGN